MKVVLCLLTLGIFLSMVGASVAAVEDESSHHYLRTGWEPEGLIESIEDDDALHGGHRDLATCSGNVDCDYDEQCKYGTCEWCRGSYNIPWAATGCREGFYQPIRILHLGDSYSAGNGARNKDNEKAFYHPRCYRSKLNWGQEFSNKFAGIFSGGFAPQYTNRACSGAETKDIEHARMLDQTRPLFSKELTQLAGDNACRVHHNVTAEDTACAEEWGKLYEGEYAIAFTDDRCILCINAQIDYVDDSYDIILLTIGGNDNNNFGDIVKFCFVPFIPYIAMGLDATSCMEKIKSAIIDVEGGALENAITSTLNAIKGRARKDAIIVLSTYPYLSTSDPYYAVFGYEGSVFNGQILGESWFFSEAFSGWSIFEPPFDVSTNVRKLQDMADEAARRAVANANQDSGGNNLIFLYDGTKLVFAFHEPHPDPYTQNNERWIWEFPLDIKDSLGGANLDTIEFYHPTRMGHLAWSDGLFDWFNSLNVGSVPVEPGNSVDLVFVIDTTGSMSGAITRVKSEMESLVDQLATSTQSFRVAVVSYRDFPERTSDSKDYPARIDSDFSSSLSSIQAGIDSLEAEGGWDTNESVFSGINAALGLSWRVGVSKAIIVIGDSPPLIDDDGREPITGLTAAAILAKCIALDPVKVFPVDTGSLLTVELSEIAHGSGGSEHSGAGAGLTPVLTEIIKSESSRPFAWIGEIYVGKTGSIVTFDASGSYSLNGTTLVMYEWDFDNDGVFDFNTTESSAGHLYESPYDGLVVLRVTADNNATALASALVVINEAGTITLNATCELDENGVPLLDERGIFDLNAAACSGELNEIFREALNKSAIQTFPPTKKPQAKKAGKKSRKSKTPMGSKASMAKNADSKKKGKLTNTVLRDNIFKSRGKCRKCT